MEVIMTNEKYKHLTKKEKIHEIEKCCMFGLLGNSWAEEADGGWWHQSVREEQKAIEGGRAENDRLGVK